MTDSVHFGAEFDLTYQLVFIIKIEKFLADLISFIFSTSRNAMVLIIIKFEDSSSSEPV